MIPESKKREQAHLDAFLLLLQKDVDAGCLVPSLLPSAWKEVLQQEWSSLLQKEESLVACAREKMQQVQGWRAKADLCEDFAMEISGLRLDLADKIWDEVLGSAYAPESKSALAMEDALAWLCCSLC